MVGFLRGLFSADGSVQTFEGNSSCTVRLATSSKQLGLDVQQLLLNFGIVSSLKLRREEQIRLMPNAQRELAEYTSKAQYELIIGRANRDAFAERIGFLQERKQSRLTDWLKSRPRPSQPEMFTTKVATIEEAGEAAKGPNGVPRFKAQTRLWDYAALPANKLDELTDILVDRESGVKDETAGKDL